MMKPMCTPTPHPHSPMHPLMYAVGLPFFGVKHIWCVLQGQEYGLHPADW